MSLQAIYCVAYLWNRRTKGCLLLPRLLADIEMRPGSCDYFVDARCQRFDSSCASDFNICLRNLPGRWFLLRPQREKWDQQAEACRRQGGDLAEFPNQAIGGAMLSFFPMMQATVNQRLLPADSCLMGRKCQVYIGAKLESIKKRYKWVRNGSLLPLSSPNLPYQIKWTFTRNYYQHICFLVEESESHEWQPFEVTDRDGEKFTATGLCECRGDN